MTGSLDPKSFPLLEQLRDVLITNPINGQVLTYNSTLGVWENGAGGSAGVSSVTGGGGVTATPTTGSVVLGVTLGGDISGSSLSAVTVAGLNGIPLDFTSSAKGDIYYYNGTDIVNLPIGTSGQVLTVASGVPAWSAASGGGVSSVNGQTGAVLLTTPNSTLTYGTSGSSTVTVDLNLSTTNAWSAPILFNEVAAPSPSATQGGIWLDSGTLKLSFGFGSTVANYANIDNQGDLTLAGNMDVASGKTYQINGTSIFATPNSWTAVQTFTNSDIQLLGSSTGYTTFASANASGTNYTITFPAATGTVALTSGANVASVSNSDGSLTISPTTGAVVASLASTVTTNNAWTGTQTFNSSSLLVENPAATHAYTFVGAALAGSHNLTLPLITGNDTLAALGVAQTWAAAQTVPSSDLLIQNPAATFAYTLVGAALAASHNLTLPLITGNDTLAALGVVQTFTAAQTFYSSDLLLTNPAHTFSYTFAGAAIVAARTITLPLLAANDTMAVLGFAQTFSALQTFQPATSVTAMAILGEQTTSATAMVNIIYTSVDGQGLGAGTYPFIQATAGADLFIGVQAGNNNVGTAAIAGTNTGVGYQALYSNTTSLGNSAFGNATLYTNTTGQGNSAFGFEALFSNTTGFYNSAFGYAALANYNNTGSANGFHVAIGFNAGSNYDGTEINDLLLGANVLGVTGESNVLRIGASASPYYNLLVGNLQATATPAVPSGPGLAIGGTLSLIGGVPLFNNIATVNSGLFSEISTTTTAVALQTTSTSIKSSTPGTTQYYRVIVNCVSSAAGQTATVVVTYKDVTLNHSTTQTQTATIIADTGASFVFLCNCVSGTALAVTGTGTTNNDVSAIAVIEAA